jgi:hypothetical protein
MSRRHQKLNFSPANACFITQRYLRLIAMAQMHCPITCPDANLPLVFAVYGLFEGKSYPFTGPIAGFEK